MIPMVFEKKTLYQTTPVWPPRKTQGHPGGLEWSQMIGLLGGTVDGSEILHQLIW